MKKTKSIGTDITAAPTVVQGFKIFATIADGWRVTFLDQDRMLMAHPNKQPVIVEMRSIQEGDVLPRATDERVSVAPQLGGH